MMSWGRPSVPWDGIPWRWCPIVDPIEYQRDPFVQGMVDQGYDEILRFAQNDNVGGNDNVGWAHGQTLKLSRIFASLFEALRISGEAKTE